MLVFSTWSCASFRTFVDQFLTLDSSNGRVSQKEPKQKQFAKYMQIIMEPVSLHTCPDRCGSARLQLGPFWSTESWRFVGDIKIKQLTHEIKNRSPQTFTGGCYIHWASTPARGHQPGPEQNSPEFVSALLGVGEINEFQSYSQLLLTSSRRACFLLTITVVSSGDRLKRTVQTVQLGPGPGCAWGHRFTPAGNAHAQFSVYLGALWIL